MSIIKQSPTVFRGEPDGVLRKSGHAMRPYFFAEAIDQALLYCGKNTQPIAAVLTGKRILDLTVPDPKDQDHAIVVGALIQKFSEWTCRYSGESINAWEYLEQGNLYDYEGDGSGERWNKLFRLACYNGFDVARVLDRTDGTRGVPTPVWVAFSKENIKPASFGEELYARIQQQQPNQLEHWLSRDHSGLLERINRLCVFDDEYRLDNIDLIVPKSQRMEMPCDPHISIYRGCPKGTNIRPGDWVTWKQSYAQLHTRGADNIDQLDHVDASDIYWAGTDEFEFFYLPEAWRKPAKNAVEYLGLLSHEQVVILAEGEMSTIASHKEDILALKEHISQIFDMDACGIHHGPDHWNRVATHAISVARANGTNPLIPYLFAWVHDSHRENEHYDPQHGPRAAQFIKDTRHSLFGFLQDNQVNLLKVACELHSEGEVEAELPVQICWDADRLDLGRVGCIPIPEYLCTPYARQEHVIEQALALSKYSEFDEQACHDNPRPLMI